MKQTTIAITYTAAPGCTATETWSVPSTRSQYCEGNLYLNGCTALANIPESLTVGGNIYR